MCLRMSTVTRCATGSVPAPFWGLLSVASFSRSIQMCKLHFLEWKISCLSGQVTGPRSRSFHVPTWGPTVSLGPAAGLLPWDPWCVAPCGLGSRVGRAEEEEAGCFHLPLGTGSASPAEPRSTWRATSVTLRVQVCLTLTVICFEIIRFKPKTCPLLPDFLSLKSS